MSRFSHKATTREEVQHEIDSLMRALDELKHDAAHDSRKRLSALRSRAESLWHDKDSDEHYADISRRTREASRAARECAKEHPLGTLALAAGAFAVIGYLITRR
jgi:ElaB/YqjD/DUF883 family membrane-anchored ribosome-binding protein